MMGRFDEDTYKIAYQKLVERMNKQVEAPGYNVKNPSKGRYGSKQEQNSRQV